MKCAQGHAVVDLDIEGRHERPDLLEMTRFELRECPFALVEVSLRARLRRGRRHLEKKGIRVTEHNRPTQRRETVEHFPWLIAALHGIAEADHAVDAEL